MAVARWRNKTAEVAPVTATGIVETGPRTHNYGESCNTTANTATWPTSA